MKIKLQNKNWSKGSTERLQFHANSSSQMVKNFQNLNNYVAKMNFFYTYSKISVNNLNVSNFQYLKPKLLQRSLNLQTSSFGFKSIDHKTKKLINFESRLKFCEKSSPALKKFGELFANSGHIFDINPNKCQ